ncbi:MAG TPA: hypothetical protein VJO52_05030, partial [Gemmatimonadaceae bacterium]|nr:hypothetical protein [Gemmatimonadaceae bacterium]
VVSPFIVAALGVGGSVAVAGLRPYAPYLLGASLLAIVVAWRLAYRRAAACALDAPHAAPARWLRVVLWGAAAVWTASLLITLSLRS